jgi:hypothetical protein
MQVHIHHVVEQLELLSPKRLEEAYNFVYFLRQQDTEQQLKKDFTQASESAFAKVWDNEEDAIYDHV